MKPRHRSLYLANQVMNYPELANRGKKLGHEAAESFLDLSNQLMIYPGPANRVKKTAMKPQIHSWIWLAKSGKKKLFSSCGRFW
jgi:hypothetical protein